LRLLVNNTGNVDEKYARHSRINTHLNVINNQKRRISSPLTQSKNSITGYLNNSAPDLTSPDNDLNNMKSLYNESINKSNSSDDSSQRLIITPNKGNYFFGNFDNDFTNDISYDDDESIAMIRKRHKSNYYLMMKKNESDNDDVTDNTNSNILDNKMRKNSSIIFDKSLFNRPLSSKKKNERRNSEDDELIRRYSFMVRNGKLKYQYDKFNILNEEIEEEKEEENENEDENEDENENENENGNEEDNDNADSKTEKDTTKKKEKSNKKERKKINEADNDKKNNKDNDKNNDKTISKLQSDFLKNTYIMRIIDSHQEEYRPKKIRRKGKPLNISERPRWVFGRGVDKANIFGKSNIY